MPKTIRVLVSPDGKTTLDFGGFQGPACLEEAARLNALLAQLGIQCEQTSFEAKPELQVNAEELEQMRQQTAQSE